MYELEETDENRVKSFANVTCVITYQEIRAIFRYTSAKTGNGIEVFIP